MKIHLKIYIIIFFISNFYLLSCGKLLGKIDSLTLKDYSPPSSTPTTPTSITTSTTVSGTMELFAANIVSPISISALPHVASFNQAWGLTLDTLGNVYVADSSNNLIRKIDGAGNVTTFAGTGVSGSTDGFRTTALFRGPEALVFDSAGNMYVADKGNSVIRKIDTSGAVSTIAGLAQNTGLTDGNGSSARFNTPAGIAFDSSTNMLYVSDQDNHNIRQIDISGAVPTFAVTTIAGSTTGIQGSWDDAVTGTNALFDYPVGLVVSYGYLYVADLGDKTIRQIYLGAPYGYGVTTFAGMTYTPGNTDGAALGGATLMSPTGVCADPAGNIYVGGASTIRKIATSGITPPITAINVSTIAGTGGVSGYADGPGVSATFNGLSSSYYHSDGNIYIMDTYNHIVRKITPTWVVSTVAGIPTVSGSEDTTGPRTLIPSFNGPLGVGIDPAGNIYVGDTSNNLVRKITAAGEVRTVAGSKGGVANFVDGTGSAALFNGPRGILVSSTGNIYTVDSNNNSVRKITPSGVVSTLGLGSFNYPVHLTEDSANNIYVADFGNNIIQKIDTVGNVTPFAGTGAASSTDGDKDAVASFFRPSGVVFDSNGDMFVTEWNGSVVRKISLSNGSNLVSTIAGLGPITFNYLMGIAIDQSDNLYVCDTANHVIRKIDTSGNITTFAGTLGVSGTDDGVRTAARFNSPQSITIDISGNFYVGDAANSTIRKITPAGVVTTIAGTPAVIGAIDSVTPASQFLKQGGITKDSSGNVYVADTFNQVIRKIAADGTASILAGSGTLGSADGNRTAASFRYPQGITINNSGNLYVADTFNHAIRQITPSGAVSTFAGMANVNGLQNGTGTAAQFNYPQGISADSSGNFYVADTINTVVRKITTAGVVTTITGNSLIPGGYIDGAASSAKFGNLKDISLDTSGNIYVTDIGNNVIRKITTLLGIAQDVKTLLKLITVNNSSSYVNNTASTIAALGSDSHGNVYAVDYINSLIYKIDSRGTTSIIVGTSQTPAFTLGSLPGNLLNPTNVYVDSSGTSVILYVLENNSIVKITLNSF